MEDKINAAITNIYLPLIKKKLFDLLALRSPYGNCTFLLLEFSSLHNFLEGEESVVMEWQPISSEWPLGIQKAVQDSQDISFSLPLLFWIPFPDGRFMLKAAVACPFCLQLDFDEQ